jgi:hypothetical protein
MMESMRRSADLDALHRGLAYEASSKNDDFGVKAGETLVCVTKRPVLCEGSKHGG